MPVRINVQIPRTIKVRNYIFREIRYADSKDVAAAQACGIMVSFTPSPGLSI